MIKSQSLAATLLALGLAVSASAQDIKFTVPGQPAATPPAAAPAAAAAPAPAAAFTDAQLLEEFGWFVGKKVQLNELNFTSAEIESMIKGIAVAAAGKDAPYEVQKIGPSMDEFLQRKQQIFSVKIKQESLNASMAFFKNLDASNKNLVKLPDGLRYEIENPGDNATFPKPTDTVTVNYSGTLVNGSVFDSTTPGQPASFALNSVISGWTEGLQKVAKGGKIKLYVPSDLAYGDDGRPGIPPGSTLIFEIELLDVKPTPAPGAPGSTPPGAPPAGTP